MPPLLTFVIPVRNDATGLDRCLRSIYENNTAPGAIEIVVLDNGSRDASADVGRRLGARVLTISGVKVAELRNIGARHASSDLLAFVDADNEIAPGWIDAALDTLADPAIAAAGAPYHAPPQGTWVQRAYGVLRGRPRGRHDTDWLGSGNLVVRRAVFEQAGGFDSTLETCEDVDLCRRLRALGHRIVSDARLESVHHGDPATLGAVFRGERWRGRDNLRVSFTPPVAWHNVPSALIPVFDVAMFGLVFAGVLAVAAGQQRVALAAILTGAAGFSAGALAKATRAVLRERVVSPVEFVRLVAVAVAYDAGRAVAVLSRAPHRNTQYAEAR